MKEEDSRPEILEGPVPSARGNDLLNFSIQAFRSGVGLFRAKHITDTGQSLVRIGKVRGIETRCLHILILFPHPIF